MREATPVVPISLAAKNSLAREGKKATRFQDALRLQESFTAGAERKALAWLASRIPARMNSDHLTLLGFVAMLFAGASYAFARSHKAGLLLATFFLALNWFGDSLDGTLARLRNRQRPRYGFYVDHMIDTFGGFFLMAGLAFSGFVDWRIAVGMFVAFLMLSIEVYLAAYTVGTFQLSFAKFGPTEIRVLLALGNAWLWLHPEGRVFGSRYRIFDVGGMVAVVGMSLMLVCSTILNTVKLYRAEKLPKRILGNGMSDGSNCARSKKGASGECEISRFETQIAPESQFETEKANFPIREASGRFAKT